MTAVMGAPVSSADIDQWTGHLAELDREQLIVALGMSDMPSRIRGEVSTDQLAAWAEQGLARKGIEYIRLASTVTLKLNIKHAMGTINAAEAAILAAIWPSIQRLDTANDCAYELRPFRVPPHVRQRIAEATA